MKFLFVVNDDPNGNETAFNVLRQALNLLKRENTLIRIFLVGDGVQCAIANQKTPDGYDNISRMIKPIAQRGQVAT